MLGYDESKIFTVGSETSYVPLDNGHYGGEKSYLVWDYDFLWFRRGQPGGTGRSKMDMIEEDKEGVEKVVGEKAVEKK